MIRHKIGIRAANEVRTRLREAGFTSDEAAPEGSEQARFEELARRARGRARAGGITPEARLERRASQEQKQTLAFTMPEKAQVELQAQLLKLDQLLKASGLPNTEQDQIRSLVAAILQKTASRKAFANVLSKIPDGEQAAWLDANFPTDAFGPDDRRSRNMQMWEILTKWKAYPTGDKAVSAVYHHTLIDLKRLQRNQARLEGGTTVSLDEKFDTGVEEPTTRGDFRASNRGETIAAPVTTPVEEVDAQARYREEATPVTDADLRDLHNLIAELGLVIPDADTMDPKALAKAIIKSLFLVNTTTGTSIDKFITTQILERIRKDNPGYTANDARMALMQRLRVARKHGGSALGTLATDVEPEANPDIQKLYSDLGIDPAKPETLITALERIAANPKLYGQLNADNAAEALNSRDVIVKTLTLLSTDTGPTQYDPSTRSINLSTSRVSAAGSVNGIIEETFHLLRVAKGMTKTEQDALVAEIQRLRELLPQFEAWLRAHAESVGIPPAAIDRLLGDLQYTLGYEIIWGPDGTIAMLEDRLAGDAEQQLVAAFEFADRTSTDVFTKWVLGSNRDYVSGMFRWHAKNRFGMVPDPTSKKGRLVRASLVADGDDKEILDQKLAEVGVAIAPEPANQAVPALQTLGYPSRTLATGPDSWAALGYELPGGGVQVVMTMGDRSDFWGGAQAATWDEAQTLADQMMTPAAVRAAVDGQFDEYIVDVKNLPGRLFTNAVNPANALTPPIFMFRSRQALAGMKGVFKPLGIAQDGTVPWQNFSAKLSKGFKKSESDMVLAALEPFVTNGRIKVDEAIEAMDALARSSVQVVRLLADGESDNDPTSGRLSSIEHELDTAWPGWRDADGMNPPTEEAGRLLDQWEEIQNDTDIGRNMPGRPESATGYFTTVNPKPLDQMPDARDITVEEPLTEVAPWYPKNATPEQVERADKKARIQTSDAVKFSEGTHFPTRKNVIGFARMYTEKWLGKAGTFIFEVQSDWAAKMRREQDNLELSRRDGTPADVVRLIEGDVRAMDTPLLQVHETLSLKAAIADAKARGQTWVAVTDAETAMMTEGHDRAAIPAGWWVVRAARPGMRNERMFSTKESAEAEALRISSAPEEDGGDPTARAEYRDAQRPTQEPGMRAAYDPKIGRLHAIMRKLTGDKGKPVSFGVHQNAAKEQQNAGFNTEAEARAFAATLPASANARVDENPINDGQGNWMVNWTTYSGSPVFNGKSDITAIAYDITGVSDTELTALFTNAAPPTKSLSDLVKTHAPSIGSRKIWATAPEPEDPRLLPRSIAVYPNRIEIDPALEQTPSEAARLLAAEETYRNFLDSLTQDQRDQIRRAPDKTAFLPILSESAVSPEAAENLYQSMDDAAVNAVLRHMVTEVDLDPGLMDAAEGEAEPTGVESAFPIPGTKFAFIKDAGGHVLEHTDDFDSALPKQPPTLADYIEHTRIMAGYNPARVGTQTSKDQMSREPVLYTNASQERSFAQSSDEKYFGALERGDMETAQRMVDEAAKAAGYTTKAYHGTNAPEFTEFAESPIFGGAWFFSETSEYPAERGKRLMSVRLNPGRQKIVKIPTNKPWSVPSYEKQILDAAKEQGFDSVKLVAIPPLWMRTLLPLVGRVAEVTGYTEATVVFTPSQIKSADPVTYDAQGNVIPLSQRFNPLSPSILQTLTIRNPIAGVPLVSDKLRIPRTQRDLGLHLGPLRWTWISGKNTLRENGSWRPSGLFRYGKLPVKVKTMDITRRAVGSAAEGESYYFIKQSNDFIDRMVSKNNMSMAEVEALLNDALGSTRNWTDPETAKRLDNERKAANKVLRDQFFRDFQQVFALRRANDIPRANELHARLVDRYRADRAATAARMEEALQQDRDLRYRQTKNRQTRAHRELRILDPEFHTKLLRFRRLITKEGKKIGDDPTTSEDLRATISRERGLWLHRSYRLHRDPLWYDRIQSRHPDLLPIINEAESFVRGELIQRHTKRLLHENRVARAEDTSIPKLSEADAEAQAVSLLDAHPGLIGAEMNRLLDYGRSSQDMFGGPSQLSGTKSAILRNRKDIPDPIRALWGEVDDPLVKGAQSLIAASQRNGNKEFLRDLVGMGIYDPDNPDRPFFLVPKDLVGAVPGTENWVPIVTEETKHEAAPLAGLFGPPAMRDALKEMFVANHRGVWLSSLSSITGYALSTKTSLSFKSQMRNIISNFGITMANGNLLNVKKMAYVTKALKLIVADVSKGGTVESREFLSEMIRLGVIHDNNSIGLIREMFQDYSGSLGSVEFQTRFMQVMEKRLTQLSRVPGAVVDAANTLYQAGDDLFKLINFFGEQHSLNYIYEDELKNAANNPEELARIKQRITKEAADIVVDTVPTYSRTPELIRMVRRSILGLWFAPYVNWTAEIIRTSANILRISVSDMASSNFRRQLRGFERFLSFGTTLWAVEAGISGVIALASMLAKAMLGDDEELKWLPESMRELIRGIADQPTDEQIRAFRELAAPPWSRNASLLFTGRSATGPWTYMDLSFTDPYDYWKRIARAAKLAYTEEGVQGTDRAVNAMVDGVAEALNPFLGIQLFAQAVTKSLTLKAPGQSKSAPLVRWDNIDKEIRDFSVGVLTGTNKRSSGNLVNGLLNIVENSLMPETVAWMQDIGKGWAGVIEGSKKLSVSNEIINSIGFKTVSTLPVEAAAYRLRPLVENYAASAKDVLNKTLTDPGTAGGGDLKEAFDENAVRQREFLADARRVILRLNTLIGEDSYSPEVLLRDAGFDKTATQQILNNYYLPQIPSDQTLIRAATSPGGKGQNRISTLTDLITNAKPEALLDQ